MLNNSVFRSFLILSTLLILAGIALIIFIQFDRGYKLVKGDDDFLTEQNNLINHVYATQVKEQTVSDNPLVMKLNKATVVIQTEPESPSQQVESEQLEVAIKKASIQQPESIIVQNQSKSRTLDQAPVQTVSSETNEKAWKQVQPEDEYQMMLLRNNPWSPHFKLGN